jgi:hypothetical protein
MTTKLAFLSDREREVFLQGFSEGVAWRDDCLRTLFLPYWRERVARAFLLGLRRGSRR